MQGNRNGSFSENQADAEGVSGQSSQKNEKVDQHAGFTASVTPGKPFVTVS